MDTSMKQVPIQPVPVMMPDYVAQAAARKDAEAQREKERAAHFSAFIKTALCFALLYTVCLHRDHAGITFPFFTAGTIYLTERLGKRLPALPWQETSQWKALRVFYIASLMLLSVSKCTTASVPLLFFDGCAILLLTVCYLLHRFTDVMSFGLLRHAKAILGMLVTPIVYIARPCMDAIAHHKLSPKQKDTTAMRKVLLPVAAGVAIAVPLLYFILMLLGSADVVFRSLLTAIEDALRIEYLPDFVEDVVRVILSLMLSLIAGYAVTIALFKEKPARAERVTKRYTAVTAITIAVLLSIVYAVFSVIQIVYLFAGQMQLPDGYTYAEYVHEGFYQLLFVSALNLLLVLLGKSLFEKSRVLQGLLTFISLCTYIMIASSALRMVMYVQTYRLTFLRLFVLWFLVVLAVLLTGLILSIYKVRFPLFYFGLVTVTVLYLVFGLARPDYHIARYNLTHTTEEDATFKTADEHYYRTVYIDDYYLWHKLSADAVPALLQDAAQYEKLSVVGSNANTYKIQHVRNWEEKNLFQKIRGFNLSEYMAWRLLSKV